MTRLAQAIRLGDIPGEAVELTRASLEKSHDELAGELLLRIPTVDAERIRTAFELEREAREREAKARKSRTPELQSLSVWLAAPDTEPEWRITGWIPTSARVVVSAQYKAGKTTLSGNLLRSLVDGDPFLGDEAASVRLLSDDETVVLLDFEMSPRQLKDWLRKQGIKRTDRAFVASMRGSVSRFNILDRTCRAEWAAILRQLNCTFLIIDCLGPILDALDLDLNSESGLFLSPLDELLVEAGIGNCWLVLHMGHEKERPKGSSRLRDWPDVEIQFTLKGTRSTGQRLIRAFGRDVDQQKRPLRYDPETRRLTFAESAKPAEPGAVTGEETKDLEDEALEALKGGVAPAIQSALELARLTVAVHPGMTGSQICKAMPEHGPNTIRAALKLGVFQKRLRVEDRGNAKHYFSSIPMSTMSTMSTEEPPLPELPLGPEDEE